MTEFVVEFEGLMMDPHLSKLGLADGVEYQGSSTLAAAGSGRVGGRRHTAIVQAESPTAATEAVAGALGADAGKFSNWQVGPL